MGFRTLRLIPSRPKSKHLRSVVLGFGHPGARSVSTTDNDAARAVVFLGQKVQPYRLNNP